MSASGRQGIDGFMESNGVLPELSRGAGLLDHQSMINFSRKCPFRALELAQGLANEENRTYKICLLGGRYHIRHESVRGSAMAVVHPRSVKKLEKRME